MKKQLLALILITISSIQSYAQLNFEKGYLIDETNDRVECLIKNDDWKNNPKEFKYKMNEEGMVQEASIQNIKEFGVYDKFKFIKTKVDIDRSSDFVNNLSDQKEPIFQEEVLFLKVLIEGEASLYQYYEDTLKRYFFKMNDSEIKQLVYKRYELDGYIILKNTSYKQQLFKNMICEAIETSDLERLRYTRNELKKVFKTYNECINSNYVNYDKNSKKISVNLSLRPGFNNSAFNINITELRTADFESKITFRFGVEAEFILPTNNDRWGIIIEPAYRSYEGEQTREVSNVSGGVLVSKFDYRSIEVPIGVRHYFNLSEKSKLFLNASYVFDFDFDSKVEFFRGDNSLISSLEVETLNFAIGAGYKYNDKFGIEFRYYTNESILKGLDSSQSQYNMYSLIFGYTLF